MPATEADEAFPLWAVSLCPLDNRTALGALISSLVFLIASLSPFQTPAGGGAEVAVLLSPLSKERNTKLSAAVINFIERHYVCMCAFTHMHTRNQQNENTN